MDEGNTILPFIFVVTFCIRFTSFYLMHATISLIPIVGEYKELNDAYHELEEGMALKWGHGKSVMHLKFLHRLMLFHELIS